MRQTKRIFLSILMASLAMSQMALAQDSFDASNENSESDLHVLNQEDSQNMSLYYHDGRYPGGGRRLAQAGEYCSNYRGDYYPPCAHALRCVNAGYNGVGICQAECRSDYDCGRNAYCYGGQCVAGNHGGGGGCYPGDGHGHGGDHGRRPGGHHGGGRPGWGR